MRQARRSLRIILLAVLFAALYYLYLDLVSTLSIASMTIRALAAGPAAAVVWSLASATSNLKTRPRAVTLCTIVFVVQYLTNLLEGYFYTSYLHEPSRVAGALLVAMGMALAQGAAASYFVPPTGAGVLLREQADWFFSRHPRRVWAWRIPLAAALWLPVYFLFGAIVGPHVVDAYESDGTGLVLPSIGTIIGLQLVRGALYLVPLLLLVGTTTLRRRETLLLLFLVLYVPGALIPFFLSGGPLPASIIPFHVAELFADSLVYATVAVLLLTPSRAVDNPPIAPA